jgi:hypothetical protein
LIYCFFGGGGRRRGKEGRYKEENRVLSITMIHENKATDSINGV